MNAQAAALIRALYGPGFSIRAVRDSPEAGVAAGDTVFAVKGKARPGQAVILAGAGGKPTPARLPLEGVPPPTLGVIVAVVTQLGLPAPGWPQKGDV